jgi:hypothetical protein
MNYAKALKNKVTKKVGSAMAAPYVKYKESQMRTDNKNYNFLKDYNAKSKSGAPISNKERAQFNQLNNK